jgi:transcriptional pleiotropic repressor
MMTMSLTERARAVNRLLQHTGASPVDFEEMARVLSEVIAANVYVIGRSGHILGYHVTEGFACELDVGGVALEGRVSERFNRALLDIDDERANIAVADGVCLFDDERPCPVAHKLTTVIPVVGGGQRLGTLLVARRERPFEEEDLVLAEWGATVVGMEILRSKTLEIEAEARQKAAVQVAIGTLSFSELEAIQNIVRELEGREGLLVASRIADRIGITRSVIVNALRKFESAGVIESRSLGMKGTYIRILNDYLLPELERVRAGA